MRVGVRARREAESESGEEILNDMKVETSITVTPTIPMRSGEVLRIRNSDGSIWRTYKVGGMIGDTKTETVFSAVVDLNPAQQRVRRAQKR